ncbi:TetR family transcriptional regulator [Nakamurella flava]|uniref:TetR family transcriptional regulator n=1 Tax=Nakamurella flava TaxID=2576308 RepID=A0A4U6Q902_9ACTN|nr:TetR/AcrR family transcriptional regulator [Nakamurella flava]TKV56353.1 TetR family transcriptional regulator [Nakamurella flava]
MARWEPGAAGRLRKAAVELFAEQGMEETTVADIAARAGVTERTFFRHFADKREVLFSPQDDFAAVFIEPMRQAPAGATPLQVVRAGLQGSTSFFPTERRPGSRVRAGVIAAHPALRERELLKMDDLAERMAATLRDRGVGEPAATLAARSGTAVFSAAFGAWLADGETRELAELLDEGLAELSALR